MNSILRGIRLGEFAKFRVPVETRLPCPASPRRGGCAAAVTHICHLGVCQPTPVRPAQVWPAGPRRAESTWPCSPRSGRPTEAQGQAMRAKRASTQPWAGVDQRTGGRVLADIIGRRFAEAATGRYASRVAHEAYPGLFRSRQRAGAMMCRGLDRCIALAPVTRRKHRADSVCGRRRAVNHPV